MTIKAGTHAPCELWLNGRKIAEGTYTYCTAIWEGYRD